MIDLHCHVLPDVDDGPATMEATVELARAADAAGIDTLVATPHVSKRIPTRSDVMQAGVRAVNARLAADGVAVTVRTGGEVDVAWAAELDESELLRLRLGGGEWLLMECPLSQSSVGPFDLILRALQARGHRIVLAHPERSSLMRRRPDLLRDLVDAGMLSSITAGSLAGRFGSEIRRFSIDLLAQGLVHNVTSDAHDALRRAPGLRDELLGVADELPGIENHLEWLTLEVPGAILGGAGIPPRPEPVLRRRARRGWLMRRA